MVWGSAQFRAEFRIRFSILPRMRCGVWPSFGLGFGVGLGSGWVLDLELGLWMWFRIACMIWDGVWSRFWQPIGFEIVCRNRCRIRLRIGEGLGFDFG